MSTYPVAIGKVETRLFFFYFDNFLGCTISERRGRRSRRFLFYSEIHGKRSVSTFLIFPPFFSRLPYRVTSMSRSTTSTMPDLHTFSQGIGNELNMAERLGLGPEVRELKLGSTFTSNISTAFHTLKCKYDHMHKRVCRFNIVAFISSAIEMEEMIFVKTLRL